MTIRSLCFSIMFGATALWPSIGAQATQRQQDLAALLQSSDPLIRASAFETLHQEPHSFATSAMAARLADLLERENQLISITTRESNGNVGLVDKYSEGFGEYLSDLAVECFAHCDMRNAKTVVALADAFPAENPYARQLAAEHGPELLFSILERARSGEPDDKCDAVAMLGNIAVGSRTLSDRQTATIDSALIASLNDRPETTLPAAAARAFGAMVDGGVPLSPERRLAIHRAVVRATSSPDGDTRVEAVRALGKFHNQGDLALLQRISQSDAARSVSGGREHYPVRDEAIKASAKLARPRVVPAQGPHSSHAMSSWLASSRRIVPREQTASPIYDSSGSAVARAPRQHSPRFAARRCRRIPRGCVA